MDPRKALVKKLFFEFIKLINREVDLVAFKREKFPNENRTMSLDIIGMEDLPTGFVFEDNQIRPIDKKIDKPTVSVELDEDLFLSIACQEITMQEAYFMGYLKARGEHSMRDFIVFDELFQKNPHVFDILNPMKA